MSLDYGGLIYTGAGIVIGGIISSIYGFNWAIGFGGIIVIGLMCYGIYIILKKEDGK